MKFVQHLTGALVVYFAAQEAMHDLRQRPLYAVWIVEWRGFEPALAVALGNFFGVAFVLAVMKIAEAQATAGRALAAGTVLV